MKKLLIIYFLFAFWGTNHARTDSLMIRYCDWNRETIHISTCSNFEWMNGYEKEYVVYLPYHVDSLKAMLTNLQVKEDEYFPVRCKLYFFNSDTIKQKVCMNRTSIAMNGKTYANNDSIIKYINDLMLKYSPCDTERFFPDNIGADYIEGNDSLYNLLLERVNEIACAMDYKRTIILRIKCWSNKSGKTTDAEVSIVKPQKYAKNEKKIARQLKDYIKKNIYWKKDIDRSKYDIIYFPIRYSGGKENLR